MATEEKINKKLITSKFSNGLSEKFDTLDSRDKLALIVLSLFIFSLVGVYGGYKVHQNSIKQQAIFDNKLNDFFWMRAQAGNLSDSQSSSDANSDNKSLLALVSKITNNLGIANVQATSTTDGVQFSFENGSQATISRVLSNMKAQNLSFSRLQISQTNDGQNYRVEAIASL